MKILHLLLILTLLFFNKGVISQTSSNSNPQEYIINDNGSSVLADYITNLYKKGQFDGIKLLDMNNESYMISAGTVTISSYKSTSSRRRVAEIRAKRNIVNFVNEGAEVTTEMLDLVEMKEKNDRYDYKSYYSEKTTSKASGFVSAMQTLTTFKHENDFIYIIYTKL